MKRKINFIAMFGFTFLFISASYAQYSKIIRSINSTYRSTDYFNSIKNRAEQLIQLAGNSDTLTIPGGTDDTFDATINGDTTTAGGRRNPNRVYKLQKNTIYTQWAGLKVINPTGTLTIVGEKGGTKPVIILTGITGFDPGMNYIQGSIKLDNIHMQNMITNDNKINDNLFVCSTANKLPQSVCVNNCLFEFINLDTFSCNGYSDGAKFKFTNCYFRNLFNVNQWWGGRIFHCDQPIDSVWVENCTVTDGGLVFLQVNSMCKFAYYNHNTIINSNKYWQRGVYYLNGYWVNNLFINQNWVGEDYNNIVPGQDPDGLLMGNFGIDTLTQQSGRKKISYPYFSIQPQYLNVDSTVDANLCGLDKLKILVSNNILWTDTVLLAPYYKNIGNKYGTDPKGKFTGCPLSFIEWSCGCDFPSQVVNVPGIWMNSRTSALFGIDKTGNSTANRPYQNIIARDNYVNVEVTTVTPAIKDASVADQMALWNALQWEVPGIPSNDILHSAYIFGDYDPTTIPGYKTEDGSGITKFTDLVENFSQTGTVKYSKIDGLPIGSLIWNDAQNIAYQAANSWDRLSKAKGDFLCDGCPPEGVKVLNTGVPASYSLSQNYPNPFNPITIINYSIKLQSMVSLKVYDVLGREVESLVDQNQKAGSYEVNFNASKLASGVYIYRLTAGDFVQSMKMMVIK